MQRPIGIFGGCFDPVHHGHLRLALEALEGAALESVSLIPAYRPPHRPAPIATPAQRLQMLRAAVGPQRSLCVDDRELRRARVSYTVDTLCTLREEHPDRPLCLILGMDAFATLTGWHQWQRLFDLAHLIVARRPQAVAPSDPRLLDVMARRRVGSASALNATPAGNIYIQDLPGLDISSTRIRASIAAGRSVGYLLPDAVLDLITTDRLYHAE